MTKDYKKWYDWNKVITLMIRDVDQNGCQHCLGILQKALKNHG